MGYKNSTNKIQKYPLNTNYYKRSINPANPLPNAPKSLNHSDIKSAQIPPMETGFFIKSNTVMPRHDLKRKVYNAVSKAPKNFDLEKQPISIADDIVGIASETRTNGLIAFIKGLI